MEKIQTVSNPISTIFLSMVSFLDFDTESLGFGHLKRIFCASANFAAF
ncbi:hypothetical protein MmTuc01_2774 [Methanosarcina mazei Tuc01]|uniref:Uncharacterized protein n=1 Tax=Methanosarcina mazei Tuc01 TaxID=1236903 RepID=M1Q6W6_METMZ|nr:hypothetical protein MmTuc01_2774 [Methanosarcina mazei Tuc01]